MSSKKKKKRFKIKPKHKNLLSKRKAKAKRELANSEWLDSFANIIYEQYRPDNVSLYRWGHNPNIGDDFKPQIFQEVSAMSVEMLQAPSPDAPKEVILQYVSWFTLSHFVTLEDAIDVWLASLKKQLKKAKPEKKDRIIQRWIEKKGQYVIKIDYTEDAGLVGPKDDGIHKEVFPFKDVDISSFVDKTFKPIKIEIK